MNTLIHNTTIKQRIITPTINQILTNYATHASNVGRHGSTRNFTTKIAQLGTVDEQLQVLNEQVATHQQSPQDVLNWAKETFDGRIAMSTSFGIQSAVLLHLATQAMPKIPIVWVDTGYLPDETYQYAQTLTEILDLNLHVHSNREWTPARMEAVYGKIWDLGETDEERAKNHGLYGRMRKVVPMEEGLNSLEPKPLALLSGLRAAQTATRANMDIVNFQNNRFKILPMLKMSDEQVVEYMDMYDLPQHPLQAQNYVTVGDWHSSRPLEEGEDARDTRFGGKFQECGLHTDVHEPVEKGDTPAPKPVEVVTSDPPSYLETNIAALANTPINPDTDHAVIMVKKLTEDGNFCRKCNDVSAKIEKDGLGDWIGYFSTAMETDRTSEGVVIAKHFEIATAPFFLVRSKEEHDAGKEWRVIRSYLQLRKLLTVAHDEVLENRQKLTEQTQEGHVPLEQTKEYKDAQQQLEDLRKDVALLSEKLNHSEQTLEDTRRYFVEKFADMTDSSSLFREERPTA